MKTENLNLKYNLHLQLMTTGYKFNKDIIITDKDGNELEARNLLTAKPVIVVRFTPYMCNPCVEYAFKLLKDIEKKIGSENIFILAGYDTHHPLMAFIADRDYNYILNIYNTPKNIFKIPVEKVKIPATMVVKDYKIECVLIFDEKYNEENLRLLSIIEQKYFSDE